MIWLVLRARSAAARFASRRSQRSNTPLGRAPMVLRWRRRRAAGAFQRAALRVGRASIVRTELRFRFDLHLATQRTIERSAPRVGKEAPGTPPAVVADRRSVSVVRERVSLRERVWRTQRFVTARDSVRVVKPSVPERGIGRSRSKTAMPTRPESRSSRLILAHRARTRGVIPPERWGAAVAAPEQAVVRGTVRAPELVWRRMPERSESGAASTRAASSAVSWSADVARGPGRAFAVQTAPALLEPAAVKAAVLDPAVLDRVTDDVIRRVERRVRIERERRGL